MANPANSRDAKESLRPFVPFVPLATRGVLRRANRLDADVLGPPTDKHLRAQYGFKHNSQQYNFFGGPSPSGWVCLLVEEGNSDESDKDLRRLDDPRVIARAFGEFYNNHLVLWHVSRNPEHAANRRRGRWGETGIERIKDHAKNQWRFADNKVAVSLKRAKERLIGTANPYAVACIVQFVRTLQEELGTIITQVGQNPNSPCARLFAPKEDNTPSPGIFLIYRTLRFDPVIGSMTWNASTSPSLFESWQIALSHMRAGTAVVDARRHALDLGLPCTEACDSTDGRHSFLGVVLLTDEMLRLARAFRRLH